MGSKDNYDIANSLIKKYVSRKDFKDTFLNYPATKQVLTCAGHEVLEYLKEQENLDKVNLDGLKIYVEMDGNGTLCIWADEDDFEDPPQEKKSYVN